jgi:glyoxylase-like metal-dependent hydrolase (beta-lactamase superfamily II)
MADTVNGPLTARPDSRGDLPAEQVRPGIWSIPVPWPGSALRYTLAYLVSGDAGAALVDTGWPTDAGWDSLARGIRATGHDVTDIRHVLVTHAHPDHLGLADRVREASGALVGMHPAEAESVRGLRRAGPGTRVAGWLRARGFPAAEVAEITQLIGDSGAWKTWSAAPDTLIEDGSLPAAGLALRAVLTPGHTPGHLCFYDEDRDLLLTGDHVLPRISPHIAHDGDPVEASAGESSAGGPDPLGDYLASLEGLRRYSPAEVLPAHEFRFTRLGGRLAALLAHHRARLAEIGRAVAGAPGASTWQIAELLPWSRGWERTRNMQRRAAVSETLAHLVHLSRQGLAVNDGQAVDSWRPGPRAAG